ncbi:MAG TPA: M56 family metallopeptidase [Pyrinomonadaceae bacterium]|nr:M56 family metallopeptidase [Pyrinomonadaceae bacterium]
MASTHEWLADFSAWWWIALANHLWQATLFSILVMAVIAASLRRAPASARYRAWLFISVKFALPSALVAALAGASGLDASFLMKHAAESPQGALAVLRVAEPMTRVAEPVAPGADTAAPRHDETYCALTLLWAAGAALSLGAWLARRRRLARSLRAGVSVAGGRELEALGRARTRLGGGRDVRLILSTGAAELGVWGALRRPLLVLPARVTGELSEDELEAVMVHELAHVERGDNLASNLHMMLCCLLWFHPLLWLVDRRLVAERERACDEEVVRLGVGREAYAAGILKVCRFCLSGQVAGVSRAAGASLGKRVEHIMRGNYGTSARHRAVVAAVAALLLTVTAAGGLFNRTSVFAETRLYKRLAEFPYELPPVRGQDPKVQSRMRMGPRTEPNTLAPELYSDKLTLQLMLVNLPGAADAASYWEGSYQLYFIPEAEERRVLDAKYKELAPNGGSVAFDTSPSDYKEKILLSEGKFKKSGLATLPDRTLRVDNISFRERVPDAQRTKRGTLMTAYSVRVFDGRLKAPVYHSNEWMARVFDADAAGDGEKLLPRTVVYANFFVSPKGDMYVSQWARDSKDTNW